MAKIMIIDDSSFIVAIIRNFAQKSGRELEIIEGHSGEEAIKKFNQHTPDLVFMDIKMDGMDGLTALEKIRADHPNAKIVMCTSLKQEQLEARAKAAGAVGYLEKPFTHEDVREMMDKYL